MVTVKKSLSVCKDCFDLVAFGNESLDYIEPSAAEKCKAGLEALYPEGYVTTGDEDYGFSYSPCQCCKSRLGGDRHELLVMSI